MPEHDSSHPQSIYDSENRVIAWDKATEAQKQEYWISIEVIKLFRKRGPDKGHGKNNRKKYRGGQKFF